MSARRSEVGVQKLEFLRGGIKYFRATFCFARSGICMGEEIEYSETATIVARTATSAGLRENRVIPWVRRAIAVRELISGSLPRENARKTARRSRISSESGLYQLKQILPYVISQVLIRDRASTGSGAHRTGGIYIDTTTQNRDKCTSVSFPSCRRINNSRRGSGKRTGTCRGPTRRARPGGP